jgi:hypothetical protein
MAPRMDCPECYRLGAECERRSREYTVAIQRHNAGAGTSAREEYSKLRTALEDARLDRDIAQREFEKHRRIHLMAH